MDEFIVYAMCAARQAIEHSGWKPTSYEDQITTGVMIGSMTAGIAVCGLGHSHGAFTARVAEQLARLVHVSNLYFNDQQILAAKAIFPENSPAQAFRARIAPLSGSRSETTCNAAFSRAVPRTHSA